MTLYFVGLGLGDEKDITVRGLETIKSCKHVYLESYTSKLSCSKENLGELYGKEVIEADRNLVEKRADEILDKAKEENVAFLVVGDPFGATTHTDLYLRAQEKNIPVEIIHNVSIINAIGSIGLELYKFGKTTSMPFWEENYKPETAYNILGQNQNEGAHTLVLLDIKADEDRYMDVKTAIEYLLQIEEKNKKGLFTDETKIIGCARIGTQSQVIKYGTAKKLLEEDFGEPLHCLIIPGKLHFVEEEALKQYEVK